MIKNKFDNKLTQDKQIKDLYDMAKSVAIPRVINEQMSSDGVGAAVFIITSVLSCMFDMIFVIMQRYNRPRLVKIIERKKIL